MKTIQMTLDEGLVSEVDALVQELRTTRSAFTREALRTALAGYRTRKLEKKHRDGYLSQPVGSDEFSGWESEQDWGDL